MTIMNERNLTLLTDFYEITMGNGYFINGLQDKIVYFDMFFREIPDEGGFVIMAGLEQLIDYLNNLHFTDEDIEFLRGKQLFDEGFLRISARFQIRMRRLGSARRPPVFPHEPLVTVRGPSSRRSSWRRCCC